MSVCSATSFGRSAPAMPAQSTRGRRISGKAPTPSAARRKGWCRPTTGASAGWSCSTSPRGRWPRKWSVRWIRSMALIRTTSRSGSSAVSGPLSASRTAPGTSIARKTRQRSTSSGTRADLELDLPGAPQRRLTVIDELGEPCGRPLRTVEVDRRSEHHDDGEVDQVAATLEHGGDRVAPIGGDDAGHTSGSERLHGGGERRFRDVGRTQPARITTSCGGSTIVAPAGGHRGERLAGAELAGGRVGAILRHRVEQRDLDQQCALIGTEAVAGEAVALQRGAEGRRAGLNFERGDARIQRTVPYTDASLLCLLPDDLLAHQLLDRESLEPLGGGAGDGFRNARERIAMTAHLESRLVGLHRNGVPIDHRGRRL